MHKDIKDFSVGQKYGGVYICKSHAIKTAKTGSTYIDMQIQDKTGEINGKCWTIPQIFDCSKIVDGDFIALSLLIEEYQGKMQARIDNIKIIEPTDLFDKSEIIPVAPEPAEKMYEEIINTIDNIQNRELNLICSNIINEQKDLLMTCPGAKTVHHAVVSGLLQHLTGMIRLGKCMSTVYQNINSDLLLSGIILHDICKLKEFSLGPVGLCIDYSKEGKLLGHITMGVSYIENKCLELNIGNEVTSLLMHMILSHHGEPDFGSAVRPMFLEAILLNQIDNIDAKVYVCEETLNNMEKGTFSDKIFGLNNIQLYKPDL